ncbi:MAG TPA: aminotransferase class V-fold PLP-dependent enzyme, partial [Actinopolymorphaceae bacterium]|nr:aminotransferase class V-fold PLP-dependent enzyme [Actinopolymorphaceae bacterium]
VVDAAQLAPHRPIDLASSGIDYVAFSGHKLYAPWGSGALVGRRDWLDEAPAYLPGGGAVREVGLTRVVWADAPERHEGGTPNVLGAVALARACQVLSPLLHPAPGAPTARPQSHPALGGLRPPIARPQLHPAPGGLRPPTPRPRLAAAGALEAHEEALRVRLTERLRTIPGVRLHRIWRDSPDAIGVVAFSVEHLAPGFVAACLSAEHGIGVRDGRFCAHPLLSRLGAPDGAVRASWGVGSTLADVDRLADAVESLVTSGARWTYELVGGRWAPAPDPRPAPSWAGPGRSASAPSHHPLPSWTGAAGPGASPCEGGVPS